MDHDELQTWLQLQVSQSKYSLLTKDVYESMLIIKPVGLCT